MASGNTLDRLFPQDISGPATLSAQLDWIAGASTPAEVIPVLAYDTATAEYADFFCKMPNNYAGGGITLHVVSSAGSTSGTLKWTAAFRRMDTAEDMDTTAHTYDPNTLTISTLPNAVGKPGYDTLAFTNGADMDSVIAGDYFILRVARDVSDTLATDAYIHAIEIRET